MSDAVPLTEQADVLMRVGMGKRDTLERVRAGLLKRPPEWIDGAEKDLCAIRAAYQTINDLAKEQGRATA